MRAFASTLLSVIILFFSCKNGKESKVNETKIDEVRDRANKSPLPKADLKVSAYLIYDDGTLSTFDVLNDKTIALWNAVAGGGDVLKPSRSTKIIFTGNLDSLTVKIKNGQKLIVDTSIFHSGRDVDYIIKNTGCKEVYVTIIKNQKLVYNDTIPFHCGE